MRGTNRSLNKKAKFFKLVFSVFVFFHLSFVFLDASLNEVNLSSEGAILINAETGAVLYEKNSHRKFYPASLTKIATASYAIKVRGEHLDKEIEAEYDSLASISAAEMERSNYSLPSYWLIPGVQHIGIKRGEVLTLKDLLYGTLVPSGGDAANVVAQYIGGTIPTFMSLVNEYLQEIGCENTLLKNPHGLHHPDHMTTPYDMAILSKEALKSPIFCEIVKTVRYQRPQTNKQKPTMLIQTNQLLKRGKYYYPKATGVKTGYTVKAQNTLVAAAKDGNRTLIAVLMKNRERSGVLSDAIALFNEAFKEKKVKRRLFSAGSKIASLSFANASNKIASSLREDAILEYFPSEVKKIKCQLQWDPLQLPIKKGQRVGQINICSQDEKVLFSPPLFADIGADYSFFYRAKGLFQESPFLLLGALLLAIFCFAFLKHLNLL